MFLVNSTASSAVRLLPVIATVCLLLGPTVKASAQTLHHVVNGETVSIAGTNNILVQVDNPQGSLVLLTGGDGRLNVSAGASFTGNADNVLVRNRDAFVAKGLNVLLVDKGTNLAKAVTFMASLKRPVTLVATSAGTPRAAEGLVAGARPERLVLTSGFLSEKSGPSPGVAAVLGDPRLLPTTLVIHHRRDACRFTKPAGVVPFRTWAGPRVRVVWLSGGTEAGNPCRFAAHHGFAGQDAELVSQVTSFAVH